MVILVFDGEQGGDVVSAHGRSSPGVSNLKDSDFEDHFKDETKGTVGNNFDGSDSEVEFSDDGDVNDGPEERFDPTTKDVILKRNKPTNPLASDHSLMELTMRKGTWLAFFNKK